MNKLIHVEGRVIIKIDLEGKNSFRFSDGTVIRLERDVENLDVKYTKQSKGTVISGEGIPEGSLILFHPNSGHDSNRIFNYKPLGGEEIADSVKYYSIPVEECFLYKETAKGEWLPLKGFAIGERVFKPYESIIEGVLPTKIKDVLYMKTGLHKGMVVQTLRASDYELIFNGEDGREERKIRCRHWEDEYNDREELIAVRDDLTELVLKGNLLVGLSPTNCNTISTTKMKNHDRKRTKTTT